MLSGTVKSPWERWHCAGRQSTASWPTSRCATGQPARRSSLLAALLARGPPVAASYVPPAYNAGSGHLRRRHRCCRLAAPQVGAGCAAAAKPDDGPSTSAPAGRGQGGGLGGSTGGWKRGGPEPAAEGGSVARQRISGKGRDQGRGSGRSHFVKGASRSAGGYSQSRPSDGVQARFLRLSGEVYPLASAQDLLQLVQGTTDPQPDMPLSSWGAPNLSVAFNLSSKVDSASAPMHHAHSA
jgi:hypothetical protein